MALSHYLTSMRKKYGDRIYISTNYGFKGEDFPLLSWKELLTEYDRPVILAMMKFKMSLTVVITRIFHTN